MARFQFKKSSNAAADEDTTTGSSGFLAVRVRLSALTGMLKALPGRLKRRPADTEDETGDSMDAPPKRPFNPKALIFPLALLLVVGGLSGTVAWLALRAEQTAAELAAAVPSVSVPVRLPDGSLRFPPESERPPEPVVPETPIEEKPVDPVDQPVTLAASRHDPLLERGRGGLLPKIGADGTQPWQYYARLFPQEDERPRIAIVLTDLGLQQSFLDAAIARLPGAVTFAFPAGLKNAQPMIDRSRQQGHEVLLTIPMEPVGYPASDPGPGTLLTSLTDENNIERLETALATATGYVGISSITGTRFTTKADSLRPILVQAQRRGLLYVDSWLVPNSQATRLATEMKLPRAVSDLLIDRVASAAGIDAQLKELERLAVANRVAVGFAQPFPVTLERLAHWSASLRDRGIVLAPVSAVVNRQATP